jgi:hypothetical protein
MSMEPTVVVTPDRYEVNATPYPNDDLNRHYFSVWVTYRGQGQWSVNRFADGRMCLNRDGEWDFEPLPSNREDGWLEQHRFMRQEAVDLAKRSAIELWREGSG